MQARWRCHKAALYYKRLKKSSIVTQCRWRVRLAMGELSKMKMVFFYVYHDSYTLSRTLKKRVELSEIYD